MSGIQHYNTFFIACEKMLFFLICPCTWSKDLHERILEIRRWRIFSSPVVLCRLIEIIDNYRNLASIGSYRLEFSTID